MLDKAIDVEGRNLRMNLAPIYHVIVLFSVAIESGCPEVPFQFCQIAEVKRAECCVFAVLFGTAIQVCPA